LRAFEGVCNYMLSSHERIRPGLRSCIPEGLRRGTAPKDATPIDAVSLLRICSHLDQPSLDHHLLGWAVHALQEELDVINIGFYFAEEDRVCPGIELRSRVADQLGGEQWHHLLGTGIAEGKEAGNLRFSVFFLLGFDVKNVVLRVKDESFGFHDHLQSIQRRLVFQANAHLDGRLKGCDFITDEEADFCLPCKQPKHLGEVVI